MSPHDLVWLGAAEAAAHIRAKRVSPTELVQAYPDRIERLDATFHAYIAVCRDEALAAARTAEQAVMHGDVLAPLHGVPIAVKDQFHARGMATTAGSRVLADSVADEDATIVARLRGSGA